MIYYTSDLHDGHKNIEKFREIPQRFLDEAKGVRGLANSLWLDDEWKHVTKRDTVIVLGDAAFNNEGLQRIKNRAGTKKLIAGNHDDLSTGKFLEVFTSVRGCKKDGALDAWLSHFPLHPEQLRGRFSIHGHVHYETIEDYRYINLSCDSLYRETGKALISQEELIRIIAKRKELREIYY